MNISNTYNEKLVNSKIQENKPGLYFRITSRYRILPQFFIIGVQKGGTTSLYKYLISHSEIIPPQDKELFFFNNAINYKKGINWYKVHFALKLYKKYYDLKHKTHGITFDPTANYFESAEAPDRIFNHFPESKIILLLRNPVERAFSHYKMARQRGFEKLDFEEALRYEDERISNDSKVTHSYVFQKLAYRAKGIYINFIRHWLEIFPRENILVLKSEDLFENPQKVYFKVLAFLDLPETGKQKFEIFGKGEQGRIDDNIRNELAEFYKPYNEELYNLLGVNFNWK